MAALSVALAMAGLASMVYARRGQADGRPRRSLPWIGPPSSVSLHVLGLSGLWLAYHLAAHAFGWSMLKAPMGWAVAGATLATAGTLLGDALQHGEDLEEGGSGRR